MTAAHTPGTLARRSIRVSEYEILGVLHAAGVPLTTLEVAQRLRVDSKAISARLSQLASYGKIVREMVRERVEASSGIGVTRRYCRWSNIAASGLGCPRSQPMVLPSHFAQAAGAGCAPNPPDAGTPPVASPAANLGPAGAQQQAPPTGLLHAPEGFSERDPCP